MPGFNKRGPQGEGPGTGRGMGKCNPDNNANNTAAENDERPRRMGRGLRNGRGKGQRRGRK